MLRLSLLLLTAVIFVGCGGTAASLVPTAQPTIVPTVTHAPTPTPVPTQTPRPTVDQTTVTLLIEVRYGDKVSPRLHDLTTALARLFPLLKNPELTDVQWRHDVDAQIYIIQNTYATLRDMTDVPPTMRGLHLSLLDATGDCNLSVTLLTKGLDTSDTQTFKDSARFMRSCGDKLDVVTKALQALH